MSGGRVSDTDLDVYWEHREYVERVFICKLIICPSEKKKLTLDQWLWVEANARDRDPDTVFRGPFYLFFLLFC